MCWVVGIVYSLATNLKFLHKKPYAESSVWHTHKLHIVGDSCVWELLGFEWEKFPLQKNRKWHKILRYWTFAHGPDMKNFRDT